MKDSLTDNLSLDNVKENVSNITSDFRSRASSIASDARERASGYYEGASEWASENRSTIYTVVGVLAFVSLAFFAYKKRDSLTETFREAS